MGIVVAVLLRGTNSSGFRDLTILYKNFSLLPITLITTTRSTSTLYNVSTLALSLNFKDLYL